MRRVARQVRHSSSRRPFAPAELALAHSMRDRGATWDEIAAKLNRHAQVLRDKLNGVYEKERGAKSGHVVSSNDPPAPFALAERERRLALEPRDLTAALLGDPLPGYSALDRQGRAA